VAAARSGAQGARGRAGAPAQGGRRIPARLQKEAKAAAEQSRRETEAKFEQQLLVLKKDAETEKRLAELQ